MILDALLNTRQASEDPNDLLTGSRGWQQMYGWGTLPTISEAGIVVDEKAALSFPAVWSAVTILAGIVGSLGLNVFRRIGAGNTELDDEHPLSDVLGLRPNPMMSRFLFTETLTGHLLLWGNAFAEIVYDRDGTIRELWPISPTAISLKRDDAGSYYYEETLDKMQGSIRYKPWQVIHVAGFSADGLIGTSPVRCNRDAIGAGIAAEKFAGTYFARGVVPTGVLEAESSSPDPNSPDGEQMRAWIDEFERRYAGLSRMHRPMVLFDSMKWKSLGHDPEKAQLRETRKFSVNEVSRIFNIPAHMLGDVDAMKWRNIEQLTLWLEKYTLRALIERIEQELTYKLFAGPGERDRFCRFDLDDLLRSDSQTRTNNDFKGFQVGRTTINEMLARDGRNGIGPAGDVRFVPKNLVPLDAAIDPNAPDGGDTAPPNPDPLGGVDQNAVPDDGIAVRAIRSVAVELLEVALAKGSREVEKASKRYAEKGDVGWWDRWCAKFFGEHRTRLASSMGLGFRARASAAGLAGDPRVGQWIDDCARRICESAHELTIGGDPLGDSRKLAESTYDAFEREIIDGNDGKDDGADEIQNTTA
jgi:HK97 family phage portal protein